MNILGLFDFDVESLTAAAINAEVQREAISSQKQNTEYAANMAYKGAHEANELNYAATTQANAANREIARETNAMNLAINAQTNAANLNLAREQNLWNEQQISKQNAYNSIGHQVDMYRAAGLNPAGLAGGSTWTPSSVAQSADLANQQAVQMQTGAPFLPAHFDNEYADAANIRMQGMSKAIEYKKDMVKNMVETAKSASELVKQNIENGLIEKRTKSEIDKNNAEIGKLVSEKNRLDKISPWELNNLIQNYYVGLANERFIGENTRLTERQARAQHNANSLFELQKNALAEIPRAELDKINRDIGFIFENTMQMQLANEFTRKHGSDYSSFASMYASDKTFSAAMAGIKESHHQYLGHLKQQWSQFNTEIAVRKYLAKQQNLNSLQIAGIMAGASVVNSVINNVTFGINSKLDRAARRTQFEQSMRKFETNPADAYNSYYQSFGTPPPIGNKSADYMKW